MRLLPGKQAAQRVAGILHPKYQVHRYSVHLTAKKIFAVDPLGQLDFGGSEFIPAGKVAIASQRRRPEDRYEWWDLGRGCFLVEFNEALELEDDEIAVLEPEERLLRAGGSHVTSYLRGRLAPLETLFQVDALRLLVKQNARISRVRVFKLDGAEATGPSRPKAHKPRKVRPKSRHKR